MTLNLNAPEMEEHLSPRITVIGVGGAGGNAVNNMINSQLEGVEFLVANTDSQALKGSICDHRIQLGRNITSGLGAGSRPEVGRAAAEEQLEEILAHLETSNMVFITAGMGGGTGTGAAPVIARAARESGILTVGVVTKPFQFEGIHRMRIAESGIQELSQYVDTLIIIPNQNLFRVANEKTTFADAFKMADDVLYSGVRGVTDLMVMPGLINLDFADIRSVMTEMGKAMMGTGEAEGDNRAIAAAEAAISNPLLDDVSMQGARGVLINITGGMDMTLFEVDEAANRIRDEVDPDANIIFGSTFDESLNGKMRVSVVSTGIEAEEALEPRPANLSLVHSRPFNRPGARPEAGQTAPEAGTASTAQQQAPVAETAAETGENAKTLDVPAEAASELGRAVASAIEPEAAPAEVDERAAIQAEPQQQEADSFMPPAPATPERRSHATSQAATRPDPFAVADLANAARSQQAEKPTAAAASRNKAYSLFRRVTGGLTGATDQEIREAAAPQVRREPVIARPSEPQAPAKAPETAGGNPAAEARQHKLAGIDQNQANKDEEDLLDIPAFLRRQAN
ncbi:cell division protein FtsZ [Algihabitans albus]|uniref:cell division protein FtsZ n=1 Tax=Algihabitans albus TaxID=2164067 RepID=UPI000E5D3857|nr:cell division protein FtsZ [Algihabitans albus]